MVIINILCKVIKNCKKIFLTKIILRIKNGLRDLDIFGENIYLDIFDINNNVP
jgi:hypothetical protein